MEPSLSPEARLTILRAAYVADPTVERWLAWERARILAACSTGQSDEPVRDQQDGPAVGD
jgi:hypothetical protein